MAVIEIGGILMYSSYKSLFKIQWKIYSIGDKPLPRALPLDTLITFVLLTPVGFLLAKLVAPILNQPYIGVALVLTGASTYLFSSFDPQGRPFIVFLYDMLLYLFSPKKRDFTFQSIPRNRRMKLYWDTIVIKEDF